VCVRGYVGAWVRARARSKMCETKIGSDDSGAIDLHAVVATQLLEPGKNISSGKEY